MQTGDVPPGFGNVPVPIHRPAGAQMDFQPRSTMPVSMQQVSDGDKSLPVRLPRAIGAHTESSTGQADQMPSTDLTSREIQSKPLPPGSELQSQRVMPPGTQYGEFYTPPASTHLSRATGNSVEFLQCTPPTHTGSVDPVNLTLPVGADAYIPPRQDAQPVCAGYVAAGIAERSIGNLQPSVGSKWPRPIFEGDRYTQQQSAPSSTQPSTLTGAQTAVMQPKNFQPSLQFNSVNVPMSLHRFNGTQMQQQYGLSEGTQRVQTPPNNYGPQPVLVHDESSLVLGRTQAYSAMFGAVGESGGVNLQSSVAAYGCT